MNQNTLAHSLWKKHILKHKDKRMCVVDGTCGNGHDSYYLSQFQNIELHCIDIQIAAIEQTKKRLLLKNKDSIYFYNKSHEDLTFIKKPIDLIVYNLGYLPGSDKQIITTHKTTLQSLKSALAMLSPVGMISIMIYTGHKGGKDEEVEIKKFINSFCVNFIYKIYNNPKKNNCPQLITIYSCINK